MNKFVSEAMNERFRNARKYIGLTQKETAEKANVSQADISRIEKGHIKNPSALYIAFLSERGISVPWLINGKGKMLEEQEKEESDEKQLEISEWKEKYLKEVEKNREILDRHARILEELFLRGTKQMDLQLGKPKGVTSPGFVVPHRVTDSVTPSYATA